MSDPIENLKRMFRAGVNRGKIVVIELYPQACADLLRAVEEMEAELRRLRISQLRRMAEVAKSRWSNEPCASMRDMDRWIRFEIACLAEIERLRALS